MTGTKANEQARRLWERYAPRYDRQIRVSERAVDLREASADALPFPDTSFDTVVCTVSLCNIPDDRAAIGEMFRVLRPGGRLVLLDHVASDRRWVLAIERLLEPLFLRLNGDYLTRRPLPLAMAAGFTIECSERLKAGIIERLTAVKPAG